MKSTSKKKNSISEYIVAGLLKNENVVILITFLSTMLIGLIAHSFMFFNKIAFFDDIKFMVTKDVGLFFNLGRWLIGVSEKILDILFGNYSVPVVCGIVSLVIIAATNVLIVKILKITNLFSLIIASSIITLSTGTIVLYAYIHAAIYYCSSIFLAVLSTYIYICNETYFKNRIFKYFLTVGLLFLSISLVQNYFLFGVIVYLYYVLISNKKENIIIKDALIYFMLVLFSIILYVLFNKTVFYICNTITETFGLGFRYLELTKYQGIDKINGMGLISIDGILSVLKHVFLPDVIAYGKLIYVYYFVIAVSVFYIVYVLLAKTMSSTRKLINIVTILFIFLAINCIYLLAQFTYIYGLTVHQKSLIFLLPVLLIDHLDIKGVKRNVIYIVMLYMIMYSIVLSNRIYLFRYFKLNNELSWYTTLVSRIESTSGFNDEYDIYIYGKPIGSNILKEDLYYKEYFEDISTIYPYTSDSRNSYNWRMFFAIWCGFDTSRIHANDKSVELDTLNNMPCYPDDGSIKVVDNKVVLKFSNYD